MSSQASASVFIVGEAVWTMLDMQTPGLNVADVAADDDDEEEARGEHVSANAGGACESLDQDLAGSDAQSPCSSTTTSTGAFPTALTCLPRPSPGSAVALLLSDFLCDAGYSDYLHFVGSFFCPCASGGLFDCNLNLYADHS